MSAKCALCGETWEKDDPKGLAHILVAHGPLVGLSPRKRNRVRKMLPQLHRRLEGVGFTEEQSHLIIREVVEELRKSGAI